MLLLYLFADEQFKVGLDLDIYVEIKPRSLSGVILSVYSSRGDYLVLQMQDGNVSISPEHLGYQDSSGFAILNWVFDWYPKVKWQSTCTRRSYLAWIMVVEISKPLTIHLLRMDFVMVDGTQLRVCRSAWTDLHGWWWFLRCYCLGLSKHWIEIFKKTFSSASIWR